MEEFIKAYNEASEANKISLIANMPNSGKIVLIQQLISKINTLELNKK